MEIESSAMLSRRSFLRKSGLVGVAATLVMAGCGGSSNEVSSEPVETKQVQVPQDGNSMSPLQDMNNSFSNGFAEARSEIAKIPEKIPEYVLTAGERMILNFGGDILTTAIRGINPNYGSEWRMNHQRGKKSSFHVLIDAPILSPLIEEFLMRFIPSYLLDKYVGGKGQMHWGVGVISSALFALPHNLYQDQNENLHLGKSLPLPFFMSGMHYWYLMRQRGFAFNLFIHSLHNSFVSVGSIDEAISEANEKTY